MSTFVYAVDKPELPPLEMPDRFQNDIRYFITQSDSESLYELPPNQYCVSLEEAEKWLEDGVFYLPSPLDNERQAEVEITEEQEVWLEWMIENQIHRILLQ